MKTKRHYRKLLILCIIFGMMFSCKRKAEDETVVRDGKYKESLVEVYKKLDMFRQMNYVPGLSFAVSIDNKVVLADGIGYSSSELKTHISPSNLVRIGQLSELITTLTAAKLSEEGKIKLDQPVDEIVPGISEKPAKYTLYQLGTHSAGIRPPKTHVGKVNVNTLENLIPMFINDDLIFQPGTNIMHSELGVDLLGYVIQKSSNEPFHKIVKRTLIDNLKLTGTMLDNPYAIIDKKCNQYNYDFIAQPVAANTIDLRGNEASAGYLSSVLDLVKIGNTLLYPGFFKQETIEMITKPGILTNGQTSLSGFGLVVNKDLEGNVFYGHSGAVGGGSAALLIYPDDKMVIAIAANIGNSTWDLPVFDVASIFKDQLHPDRKKSEPGKPQKRKNKNL